MNPSVFVSTLVFVGAFVACGAPAPGPPPATPAAPPVTAPPVAPATAAATSCAGSIPSLPELEATPDVPLAEKAIGKEGDGRLCQAKSYRVKTAMIVHRVWDGSKPESRMGRWWALEAPRGNTADYRRAYAICSEWSAADRSVTCKVKAGSQVVLGTGQSAKCADGTLYPTAATVQMFVPDPAGSIDGCTAGQAFP